MHCRQPESLRAIGASPAEVACLLSCFEQVECAPLETIFCDAAPVAAMEFMAFNDCWRSCAERHGFRCRDAQGATTAVPSFAVCDGVADCSDRSDEEGCALFSCGSGERVVEGWVCDGLDDCLDGSDELQDCPSFACANGETVSAELRCDGEPDCSDASDEADCPGAFQCSG